MPFEIGDTIDFNFSATSELSGKLSDFRGQKVILYFYPKDSTPGCTQESIDFTTDYQKFTNQNVAIFGLSRDSLKSHEKFKAKFEMPFELISDEDESICKLFDVIKEKNMYGKKVMGIVRSTFLIDEEGKLEKQWIKVKVPGHVEEVLGSLG